MLFSDADWASRAVIVLPSVLVLFIAGLIVPDVAISDVRSGVDLESHEAQRYVEARVGNAGGLGQKALRTQVSIIDSRPDPAECDWGYPEPVTEILTVRTYTLWGIPLETWEVTCNSERLVGGPLSW